MKKVCVLLGIIGLLAVSAVPALAGGIINKSNLSSDWIRTLNRNAATDAADIVVFNPAGVMKLKNGLYTKVDALYFAKDYSNTVPNYAPNVYGEDGDFKTDTPSLIPGLFAVYKQDKWAGFFAITIPGGGGKVEYDQGNARTSLLSYSIAAATGFVYNNISSMNMEANSFDVGYTFGGAYKINDVFSVAGGFRYLDAKQEFKGSTSLTSTLNPALPALDRKVDLDRDATGWSYFLGLNISPNDKLNLAAMYMSNTDLDYKSDVAQDDLNITPLLGWADGTKQREDLPGQINLGASYQFTPKLRTEVNYTLYLETDAKFEASRLEHAGDSWEMGICFDYAFNPRWMASLGYLYTDIKGISPEDKLVEAPELDSNTVSTGVVYTPSERWRINLGLLKVWYDSVTTSTTGSRAPAGTKLEKDVWGISFGVQYRFL